MHHTLSCLKFVTVSEKLQKVLSTFSAHYTAGYAYCCDFDLSNGESALRINDAVTTMSVLA